MRTKVTSRISLLFLSFAMLLAIPAVAFADIVYDSVNDVSASVGSRTIVVGDSTSVGFRIQNQNTNAGDTQNSCNPGDTTPANLSFKVTDSNGNLVTDVTATPSPVVVNSCETNTNTSSYDYATFTSEKAGTYTIEPVVTDSGGGKYDTSAAKWSLTVNKAKTQLTNVSGNGTSGQSNGSLTAKLSSFKTDGTTVNKNLANKSVTFEIDGNAVSGTATTDNTGVATLNGVDLSGVSAGSHNVKAIFAQDDGYLASSGTGTLNVAPPPDSTPPVITADVTGTKGLNDWYTSNVNVDWTVSDGQSAISSQSGCADFSVTSDQAATTYTCSATSGGGTASKSVTIKRDATAPVVSGSDINDTTWRNTDRSASFTASDAGSGLASAGDASFTLTASQESTNATTPTTVSKTVTDAAGNSATRALSAKIDKTAPSVSASVSPDAAASGWYNQATGAPTVEYTCSDGLSGLSGACPADHTFGEGANQSDSSGDVSDLAGNKASASVSDIDVDLTAPAQPSVTFTPANPVANSGGFFKDTVTVSYGSSDAGSGIKSVSDDQTFDTTGTHDYSGFAEDNAGNKSAAASGSVKVDADAPVVNPNSVVNSVWRNSSLSQAFTASDAGSGLANAADASFTLTASDESQGANSPTVDQRVVSDKVGHSVTRSVSALIDLTKPSISASTTKDPAPSGWYNLDTGAPVVRFQCSDLLSGIAAGACPADHTITTEGTDQGYSDSVSDRAGNENSAGVSGLKIDLTAPNAAGAPDLLATSDSGDTSDNLTNDRTPTFSISAEAGSTVRLYGKEDGAANATLLVSGPATNGVATLTSGQSLSDGTYTIHAEVTDQAGNVSSTNNIEVTIVTVDATAPGAPTGLDMAASSDTGSSNSDNVTSDNTPTINGSAEANSQVELFEGTTSRGTAQADGSGAWSITSSQLADGARSLTAKATDAAGNTSQASGTLSVTVDTHAPGAPSKVDLLTASDTGSSQTDDVTTDTTPTFDVTAEAGSNVNVFKGTGATSLGSAQANNLGLASVTLSQLADGTYSIHADATDAAGNVSASSATINVTVDLTVDTAAPQTTIDSQPAGFSNNASPSFTFSSSEAGSTFQCSLDGGAFSACASPRSYSGLNDGSHTFAVKATDAAGNTDATEASYTWTVDTVAPNVTATPDGPADHNGWYNNAVSISFGGTDTGGSGIASCDPAVNYSGPDSGTASVMGKCTDKAGNSASGTFNFKYDATSPTLNPSVSPNPVLLNGSATATANAADATSGVASQNCDPVNTSSVGAKSVTCSATDNAGNSASASASYNVNYNFAGFRQPVDNGGIFNAVKAGQSVPMKFSLSGNQGLGIIAAGYPKVTAVACPGGSGLVDAIEETTTANNGLTYDATADQYNYVWKTQSTFAGKCYRFDMKLIDGTTQSALFKFTK
jgi:hypothetical protein